MAITTIQLGENVKRELERMKESRSDTYEEVILTLIGIAEEMKRGQRELLIEGCKEMASDSLKITKEWETTDASLDWKW
jgi:predicted CopG family antitoxin